MAPKRSADAADLGAQRRSTRQRSQQGGALPRTASVNNGGANQVGQEEDELAQDSPAYTIRMPRTGAPVPSAESIPTPPSTKKRRPQKVTRPLPPPSLASPLPRSPSLPSPPNGDSESLMDLVAEPDWQEPDYLKTYRYFSDHLHGLTGWREIRKDDKGNDKYGSHKSDWEYHNGDIIDKLCEPFFGFVMSPERTKNETMKILGGMDQTAARIISYVTMGGRKGRDDWYEIFKNPETRKAVVYAVVGFIMQEHVFSSLCYGASDAEIEELHVKVDLRYCGDKDGFYRTKKRARRVRELLFDKDGRPQPFSNGFIKRSKELAWQTYSILAPILALHPRIINQPPTKDGPYKNFQVHGQRYVLRVLFELITRAGRLSLQMRLDSDTVYLMTPAHKDEYYDASGMWVLNDDYMRRNNRYHNDKWEGMPKSKRAQWRAAIFDLALVRICCFPGFVAFKKGGWDKRFKNRGVRVYRIQDKAVALRWGTEKPLTPAKGTWYEWWRVWGKESGRLGENSRNDGDAADGAGES